MVCMSGFLDSWLVSFHLQFGDVLGRFRLGTESLCGTKIPKSIFKGQNKKCAPEVA